MTVQASILSCSVELIMSQCLTCFNTFCFWWFALKTKRYCEILCRRDMVDSIWGIYDLNSHVILRKDIAAFMSHRQALHLCSCAFRNTSSESNLEHLIN